MIAGYSSPDLDPLQGSRSLLCSPLLLSQRAREIYPVFALEQEPSKIRLSQCRSYKQRCVLQIAVSGCYYEKSISSQFFYLKKMVLLNYVRKHPEFARGSARLTQECSGATKQRANDPGKRCTSTGRCSLLYAITSSCFVCSFPYMFLVCQREPETSYAHFSSGAPNYRIKSNQISLSLHVFMSSADKPTYNDIFMIACC